MKPHIVKQFDELLDGVKQTILSMGRLAEQQLQDAVGALDTLDAQRCEAVLSADEKQDAKLLSVENQIIDLLALRHPMADDLRRVIAALRGSRDIERIGDYAKNIAKHTTTLSRFPRHADIDRVMALAKPVRGMLADVVSAYERTDANLAIQVRRIDADIDQQYTELFKALLHDMEAGTLNPTAGTHLLFIARCLERIGDHVTNLAEDVMYVVEGALPSDDRDRADRSHYSTGSD